jgi:hypothetical protein
MTPLYLLKTVFPKFDPLTVTGMALYVNVNFPLVRTNNEIVQNSKSEPKNSHSHSCVPLRESAKFRALWKTQSFVHCG